MNMFVWSSANEFSHDLLKFAMMTMAIMVFFLGFVLMSMAYVLVMPHAVKYMGMKKASAELYAFLFSLVALLVMGFPSMSLLYNFSAQTSPHMTVKMVGSQWYWSFEVMDLMEDAVPMYMVPTEDLNYVGSYRLLEVDNYLVVPTSVLIQFNITSSDVIHSFALPSMGVKVDATAGLLCVVPVNTGWEFDQSGGNLCGTWSAEGVYYGQCSEICGMNHAFMPIGVEVTSPEAFKVWCLLSLY